MLPLKKKIDIHNDNDVPTVTVYVYVPGLPMGTACTVNLYLIFYIYNMKVCLYCNSIDENFNVQVNGPNCTGQGVCVCGGGGGGWGRDSVSGEEKKP